MGAAGDLFVQERPGRAPAVVLLHEGANSAAVWDDVADVIGGGRRTLAYDRRGFGRSQRNARPGPGLFDDDVADLAAVLAGHGVEQAHLLGHSDGGTVALLAAARLPAVRSICVVDTHVRADPGTVAGLRALGDPSGWAPPVVDSYRSRHGEDWLEVVGGWLSMWTGGALAGWSIRPELAAITVPVLVLHDRADDLAPAEHAEAIVADVPAARVHWFETGSHRPHRRERARFVELVTAFWDEVERA